MNANLIFHQLFEAESCTYTYLLADSESKEAVLIDPVLETTSRDTALLQDLGLTLKYILETHVHADHVTSAGKMRALTGAKSAWSAAAGVSCADIALQDGDVLPFGRFAIKALMTPGHTDGCVSFACENFIFTGDALLIGGTGRTDFQGGSAANLYQSIFDKLFTLPDETLVYPAHDYGGHHHSTIGTERECNPRVGRGKSKEDFIQIMAGLNLPYPKKIDAALPANRNCGLKADASQETPPGLSPSQLAARAGKSLLVDVRTKAEYEGELGHIGGSKQAALGEELVAFLKNRTHQEEIIFICAAGKRSAEALRMAKNMGFTHAFSLAGGIEGWARAGLSVEHST